MYINNRITSLMWKNGGKIHESSIFTEMSEWKYSCQELSVRTYLWNLLNICNEGRYFLRFILQTDFNTAAILQQDGAPVDYALRIGEYFNRSRRLHTSRKLIFRSSKPEVLLTAANNKPHNI
jgi:hypothetical protein